MCALAAPALMIGSTLLSGLGSIMQGNAAAEAGAAQQEAYRKQADRERMAASYEASRVSDRNRRAGSAALVEVAGSGVTLTGSPTEVMADNARQGQMDIDAILFNSGVKQETLRTQGDLAMMQGEQRQQAGYIGAATNVASGLSDLYRPRNAVMFGQSQFARAA